MSDLTVSAADAGATISMSALVNGEGSLGTLRVSFTNFWQNASVNRVSDRIN
jgi:hypothetical protein